MASRKDDDGLPPKGATTSPPAPGPPARARPQIRPIGAPSGGSLPPRARAPISLPSGARGAPPPSLAKPVPRFPAAPIEDTDDDPTRTEIPADLFQEPPPPNKRAPQPTLRGQAPPPARALGNPRPAPAPRAPAPASAPVTRPAPRVSAPTPIPPRTTSPGPVFTRPQPRAEVLKAEAKPPPSRMETTSTEALPAGARPAIKPAVRVGAPAPRGEVKPSPLAAKPQRPSIDIVPKEQRSADPPERTVVMPAAPARPVRARAGFAPPREPETARPPAPSVPSLDALIEPIAPARQPSTRPPGKSPFVHQRPLDDVRPQIRTDRPAARPASVAPPQLHPPSFPPPANGPAGYDHQDSTVAMARPWTPPAPAVQPMAPMQPMQPMAPLPGVAMTPQAIPIMPHPGFAPAQQGFVPPPHLTGPVAPPRPLGIVLFAAPLLLATGLVAALALLF